VPQRGVARRKYERKRELGEARKNTDSNSRISGSLDFFLEGKEMGTQSRAFPP
jgi:hypothetical protein